MAPGRYVKYYPQGTYGYVPANETQGAEKPGEILDWSLFVPVIDEVNGDNRIIDGS